MDTKGTKQPMWEKRSNDRYRRSDNALSVMLIHLTAGWRYLIYDRIKHDYIGKDNGYDTAEEAMVQADLIGPSDGPYIPFYVDPISAASTLGRLGGLAKSEAKAIASKENGKKGGRPRKVREERTTETIEESNLDLFK